MELAYDELRRIALGYLRRERPDHTLEASGLVHEAYLRLLDQHPEAWKNRLHFFAMAATLMRRILVDHARRAGFAKRGGGAVRLPLEEAGISSPRRPPELLDLDEALAALAELDEEQARIVELRYFGGLTAEEIGVVLSLSSPTVTRRWRIARSWLYRYLAEGGGHRS
ncbi:MAG: sigma-70 family RNA polymerase sigma factor [Acidobacteria bacterium]|nr:sigma-70 family RNA polymerase sigma factor [Acidobacteriota bacterium]